MENKGVNTRFKALEWAEEASNKTVMIIGAGGIGSWLSLFIARIGSEIFIFDGDNVDNTNMSGQHYSIEDVGRNKAELVVQQGKKFSKNDDIYNFGNYDKDSPSNEIVFSCLDNMHTRKLAFEKWKDLPDRKLFIDGRMLAESIQIFAVQKGQEKAYEKTLFADESVPDLQCSAKATTHCGALIASKMTGIFTNFVFNEVLGEDFREVPFRLYYDIDLMHQDTDYNTKSRSKIKTKKYEETV